MKFEVHSLDVNMWNRYEKWSCASAGIGRNISFVLIS